MRFPGRLSPSLLVWCVLYAIIVSRVEYSGPDSFGLPILFLLTIFWPIHTEVFIDLNCRTLDLVACSTRPYLRLMLARILAVAGWFTVASMVGWGIAIIRASHSSFPEKATFDMGQIALITLALCLVYISTMVLCRTLGKAIWVPFAMILTIFLVGRLNAVKVEDWARAFLGEYSIFSFLSSTADSATLEFARQLLVTRILISLTAFGAFLVLCCLVLIIITRRTTGIQLLTLNKRDMPVNLAFTLLLLAPAAFALTMRPKILIHVSSEQSREREIQVNYNWRRAGYRGVHTALLDAKVEISADQVRIDETITLENPEGRTGDLLVYIPRLARNLASAPPLEAVSGETTMRTAAFVTLDGSASQQIKVQYSLPSKIHVLDMSGGMTSASTFLDFTEGSNLILNAGMLVRPNETRPNTPSRVFPSSSPFFDIAGRPALSQPPMRFQLPARYGDYRFFDGQTPVPISLDSTGVVVESFEPVGLWGYAPSAEVSPATTLTPVLRTGVSPHYRQMLEQSAREASAILESYGVTGHYWIDSACLSGLSDFGFRGHDDDARTLQFRTTTDVLRCFIGQRVSEQSEFYALLFMYQRYVPHGSMKAGEFRDQVRAMSHGYFSGGAKGILEYAGLALTHDTQEQVSPEVILKGLTQSIMATNQQPSNVRVTDSKKQSPFDALGISRPYAPHFPDFIASSPR